MIMIIIHTNNNNNNTNNNDLAGVNGELVVVGAQGVLRRDAVRGYIYNIYKYK